MQTDNLEGSNRQLVGSVEDEVASRSASYLDHSLGATDVTSVRRKDVKDKGGFHKEVDAMAVGKTQAIVRAEVRVLSLQGESAHVHALLLTVAQLAQACSLHVLCCAGI